jgi:hypothetical protein
MPASLLPRERNTARICEPRCELRTGEGLLVGASQQEIARALFGDAIPAKKWRPENPSYGLRVQSLVSNVRRHPDNPLAGP